MASPAGFNLDSTLGAAFLGNVIASAFYGITCVQTFTYYKHNYKDPLMFKVLMYFLWFLDTLHLAIVTHALYYYLVSNFGNFKAIASPAWSVLAQIYLTCLSDIIIRGIFGRRVWLLTGRNNILAGCIVLTSLTTFITAFAFSTKAYAVPTFEYFNHISYFLYTGFASGVAADVLIAGSLCFTLSRSRTGIRKTDSLLNVLMLYSINTSLLTTICTLATLITYAIWPEEFTFIGIYFSLSKLYLNSLLATLNSREAFSEKINSPMEVGLSDMSSHRIDFAATGASGGAQPVVVSMNRPVAVGLEKRAGDEY